MISQNALHHAEKCRFCWMCRHLCPVQHQTGKELNTPRAKGLLLSMVNKKAQEFDKDMGQAMYECLLCDACTNDCATGYQPPLFIREARTEAVVSEVAPASVMKLIENVETTGNIYGVEKPSYGQDGTDVLVYIGEVAAIKVPEMAKHLLALLAKAGVSAKVLANEPASGVMLGDLMGYTEEVRKQAEVCAKTLNETGLPRSTLSGAARSPPVSPPPPLSSQSCWKRRSWPPRPRWARWAPATMTTVWRAPSTSSPRCAVLPRPRATS